MSCHLGAFEQETRSLLVEIIGAQGKGMTGNEGMSRSNIWASDKVLTPSYTHFQRTLITAAADAGIGEVHI